MSIDELAKKLSRVDELEVWKVHVSGYPSHVIASAYEAAIPLWVERMLNTDKLLVHPDVAEALKIQGYIPNDLQIRMIWASILATDTSPQSKKRMYRIKEKLTARYGMDWWEDVFKRKNKIYAVSQEIKESQGGAATSMFLSHTLLGVQCASDEKNRVLKKLSKN